MRQAYKALTSEQTHAHYRNRQSTSAQTGSEEAGLDRRGAKPENCVAGDAVNGGGQVPRSEEIAELQPVVRQNHSNSEIFKGE